MNLMQEALIAMILASISDFMDGLIARLTNKETILGAYLDPVADKFLITTTYLILFYKGYIIYWMAILVILRDVFIVLGGAIFYFNNKSYKVPTSQISKVNTAVQLMYILWVLSYSSFPMIFNWKIDLSFIVLIAFTTVTSGMLYVKHGFMNIRSNRIKK